MQMTEPTELLIVEGRSAEQALKSVVARRFQSVLAMQGKVPNAERVTADRLTNNPACQRLFEHLGCGTGVHCHPDDLRFDRLILVSDGDIDGLHAQALLLSVFRHYLTPLVASGRVMTVTCPVYAIRTPPTEDNTGATDGNAGVDDAWVTRYAWSEHEQRRHLASMADPANARISYIKGIASLPPDECHTLLVNPATRLTRPLTLTAVSD